MNDRGTKDRSKGQIAEPRRTFSSSMKFGAPARITAYIGTVVLLGVGLICCSSLESAKQAEPAPQTATTDTTVAAGPNHEDSEEAADPAKPQDMMVAERAAEEGETRSKKRKTVAADPAPASGATATPAEPPPPVTTQPPAETKALEKEVKKPDVAARPKPAKGRLGLRTEIDGNITGGIIATGEEEEDGDGRFDKQGGEFSGREITFNAPTRTAEDALSTFAIDVDTAAYSIARRTLDSDRMPTGSLVRVEEFINYFRYNYEPPVGDRNLFSIQTDGAVSPADPSKHLLRVGIQARIVEDADRLPANLVFLVDTSCSMTSQDKLALAKKALKTAVDHLSEKDHVAITTYAGGVRKVLGPTSAREKAKIKRAIDSLESGGGTAMQDGLELAYKQAASMLRPESITRIVVCSDGDANIGLATPEALLGRIEGYVKEGVGLSTIGFGDGNYKDEMMEKLANRGNGNYYYVDSMRQADRIFGRDMTKMLQDVAQDVKIQVEFDAQQVLEYRLVGYENRDVADADFRNDKVDAGEIGAGHQVTALYEMKLVEGARGRLATVRVRAKLPGGSTAKEVALEVPTSVVDRAFIHAPEDLRFATAVMGGAELLRQSPHARGWTFARVIDIVAGTDPRKDADRAEFMQLMRKAAHLSGEGAPVGMR